MYKRYVLDACALIAFTNLEQGASIVADLFNQADSGKIQIIMNRINLYEVYYGFYRENGQDYALEVINKLEASPVAVAEFDRELMLEAGRIKGTYKMSLADSIAIAQTILLDGSIITADHHEFDKIDGKENLHFTWIR